MLFAFKASRCCSMPGSISPSASKLTTRFLQQVRDTLAIGGLDKRLRSSREIPAFLEVLKNSAEPSVILLDTYLDGQSSDGRSIVKQLRARYPHTLIVTVRECMAREADDFLFKSQDEKQPSSASSSPSRNSRGASCSRNRSLSLTAQARILPYRQNWFSLVNQIVDKYSTVKNLDGHDEENLR